MFRECGEKTGMAIERGPVQRRVTKMIRKPRGCTVREQVQGDGRVAAARGPVQGRAALPVLGVHIRAALDEKADDIRSGVPRRPVQKGDVVIVTGVGGCAARQEALKAREIATADSSK